jgi:hypothetical protein
MRSFCDLYSSSVIIRLSQEIYDGQSGQGNESELRSTLSSPFCFLYNLKFRLADCRACHLLSTWNLALLIL